jgi:hypothetical protein
LEFSHFLWFGQTSGERLASLDRYKTGTQSERNAQGIKTERPNIGYLIRTTFTQLNTIEDVVKAPLVTCATAISIHWRRWRRLKR